MASGAHLNREYVARYRRWLDATHYSGGVIQRYSRIAQEFCDLLRNRKVERSTDWDVRRFLILKSRKCCGYSTVYDTFIALRSFFEFLSLGGITSVIRLRNIRLRAPNRNPPVVPSAAKVLRFIQAAKEPRDRAIVELLYASGCRIKELVDIKVDDIDFDSRKILVTGKFAKSRYVVFGHHAQRAMKMYLGARRSGYLFQPTTRQKGSVYKCSKTDTWVGEVAIYLSHCPAVRKRVVFRLGRRTEISLGQARRMLKNKMRWLPMDRPISPHPMATNTIRGFLDKLAFRAGVDRITPREFRHCFATHMLEGGADTRQIQELLGHACLTATQIYTHVARKKLLQVFDHCHPRGNRYGAERIPKEA
jgi:site-specific recombinase XerD